MSPKFLQTYNRILDVLQAFFRVAFVIRFSIAMTLLVGLTLRFAEQALEALRVLAADYTIQPWPLILFIVSALIFSLLSWYWARVLLYLTDPLPKAEGVAERAKKILIRHLPRFFGSLPLLFIAWALWTAADSKAVEAQKHNALLKGLAVANLLMALLLYTFFHFRHWLIDRLKGRKGEAVTDERSAQGGILPSVSKLAKSGKLVFLLIILSGLCLLFLFTFQLGRHQVVQAAIAIGPMGILLLFAAFWVTFGSWLVYLGKLTRLPLFLILLILAFSFSAADWNDNHVVRYKSSQQQKSAPMDVNAGFKQWLSGRCDLDNYRNADPNKRKPYPVFIVSAEGGGLRAAYFASLVLSKLQDADPSFAHHVFAISGVSGGSLGGAVFAALAHKYLTQDGARPCAFHTDLPKDSKGNPQGMREMADKILGQDLLSPLLASLLYPDLLQRFLPFRVNRFDRARALEDALGYYWNAATGGNEFYVNCNDPSGNCCEDPNKDCYLLSDLYQDQARKQSTFATGSTPALFLNTTRVETGEQLVVGSLNPRGPDGEQNKRLNGLTSLADLDSTVSFPLCTAAYLSARFPVVAPAGYLMIQGDKVRFVDGGYFENSGTASVLDLLSAMQFDGALNDPVNGAQVDIQLIIIRIGSDPNADDQTAAELNKMQQQNLADLRYKWHGLGEITSPIFAVVNGETARGTLSVRETETALSQLNSQASNGQNRTQSQPASAVGQRIEQPNPASQFHLSADEAHFRVNQTDVQLPLGYLLSNEARQNMNDQIEKAQTCGTETDANYYSFQSVLAALKRKE